MIICHTGLREKKKAKGATGLGRESEVIGNGGDIMSTREGAVRTFPCALLREAVVKLWEQKVKDATLAEVRAEELSTREGNDDARGRVELCYCIKKSRKETAY